MPYEDVPSEVLSDIIELLLSISCKFEYRNGRYVIRKGEDVENDISRLKELSQKVPEPLSSLLVSTANSSDNFFRLWSKTVDTLLELSKSNYIDR